jgi:lactate dehydrogenase-like 2-hydroxyacid dehydrogenase
LWRRYAVGFDNINRADANQLQESRSLTTADVLTEATAEFAFFLLGALARKTVARRAPDARQPAGATGIRTCRSWATKSRERLSPSSARDASGWRCIKKCAGFDMNILCFDPAYENHEYIKAIQEVKDLRFQRGISRERATIRYTTLHEALRSADFISLHVPLLREGESATPTYHLINEARCA